MYPLGREDVIPACHLLLRGAGARSKGSVPPAAIQSWLHNLLADNPRCRSRGDAAREGRADNRQHPGAMSARGCF